MTQGVLFESEADKRLAAQGSVAVLVPYPVDKPYDYLVPEGMRVAPGDYVCVPLGSREITGVVWGPGAGDVDPAKLKEIVSRYDIEPMQEVTRQFVDWVAGYTLSAKGSVLKMALSVSGRRFYRPSLHGDFGAPRVSLLRKKGLTEQRKKVLEVMADGQTRRASEIAQEAGCSAGVVSGMADKGLLEEVSVFKPGAVSLS